MATYIDLSHTVPQHHPRVSRILEVSDVRRSTTGAARRIPTGEEAVHRQGRYALWQFESYHPERPVQFVSRDRRSLAVAP
jgi:hypothetical protein